MSFAHYRPPADDKTNPLIIWLHGGGEGGSDPTIPLLANRAANYASKEIQDYFGGAYVLVPQCPGAWMDNQQGEVTWGKENDVYNVALMALIADFVEAHPDIDRSRIYVGGCSNGGYMSLKLILMHPDYFAAGFISALAYRSEYISDEQIRSIAHVPIWFIHSKDDMTTRPEQTVIPIYRRLKENAAQHVHLSLFEQVIDVSGAYGGEELRYPGHWSWIYSHTNNCRLDYDGKPVILKGSAVTLMDWMAAQGIWK
jgi:predicted peptidase